MAFDREMPETLFRDPGKAISRFGRMFVYLFVCLFRDN